MGRKKHERRIGSIEQLEPRELLAGASDLSGFVADTPVPRREYHPMIMAGDPGGLPPDSPAARVDPNVTTSPFAGVGSLKVATRSVVGSCTATPIDSQHVLTAGHCLDMNDDGRVTRQDGLVSVTFNLNYGSDLSHQIAVSDLQIHPDYSGFNRPSVNDDVAVLTLASPLPSGVPIYPLYTGVMNQTLVMVGYGQSGNGISGYTTSAGYAVKRRGENLPDRLMGQDDLGRAPVNEVFEYDFDGPTGNGLLGGPTLGNNREATTGPGDSGGPSFVLVGSNPALASSYAVAGINTFGADSRTAAAPLFGSYGGGMIVATYASWIQIALSSSGSGLGGSGGGASRGGSWRRPVLYHVPMIGLQTQPGEQPATPPPARDTLEAIEDCARNQPGCFRRSLKNHPNATETRSPQQPSPNSIVSHFQSHAHADQSINPSSSTMVPSPVSSTMEALIA